MQLGAALQAQDLASAAVVPKPAIREDALRAAFIYRLATFVSWPKDAFASTSAPLTICLLAGNSTELERVLKLAAGKVPSERAMQLRVLHADQTWVGCHLLYAQQSPVAKVSEPLSPYTLVVVDSLEKLKRTGHLALVMEKKQNNARLVFYAERKRIGVSTFKLSAKLLQLLKFI